ncbi:YqcC family protein [Marinobacter halodurans]|uniref:YqcC family protein n=1 Tax=Marinobacter halodurans TaxID=2528979 RepID=A0ABY1ZKN4_9GAMM|nr:YqcC family protein [Marinobacter halodurans]TBW54481.1 YqcC family protein [Marinobacter halodurans]
MAQTNDEQVTYIADGLLAIEVELRRLDYWEHEPPEPEALQSSQPFCVDTLTFTQWLQFIFLPRMKDLIEEERALPAVSGIAPMAEEFFRQEPVSGRIVINELARIDALLSGDA